MLGGERGRTKTGAGPPGLAGWSRTVDTRLQHQADTREKGRGWDEPGSTPSTAMLFNSGRVAAPWDCGIRVASLMVQEEPTKIISTHLRAASCSGERPCQGRLHSKQKSMIFSTTDILSSLHGCTNCGIMGNLLNTLGFCFLILIVNISQTWLSRELR